MAIIIQDLDSLPSPLRNPVLTIGNFDGVHMGHLALFQKVKERASDISGQSVVMTFDPHPIKMMMPEKAPLLITPTNQKLQLIENAGIDVIICISFNRQFASISARDFVQDILVDKIGVKELIVGHDYSFGRNREGGIDLINEMGNSLGFKVHVIGPVKINDTLVSSTSIRKLVAEGNLREAKRLLGRDYQIRGTVKRGQNRGGRLLGFPTANLELFDELSPRPGVYAVEVLVDDSIYYGLTNIGYNPTFRGKHLSIETHILDFSKDLLGKTIRLNFLERLRDEKRFKSFKELSEQIGLDVERARRLFSSLKKIV